VAHKFLIFDLNLYSGYQRLTARREAAQSLHVGRAKAAYFPPPPHGSCPRRAHQERPPRMALWVLPRLSGHSGLDAFTRHTPPSKRIGCGRFLHAVPLVRTVHKFELDADMQTKCSQSPNETVQAREWV
jgi:hypothetical protein